MKSCGDTSLGVRDAVRRVETRGGEKVEKWDYEVNTHDAEKPSFDRFAMRLTDVDYFFILFFFVATKG